MLLYSKVGGLLLCAESPELPAVVCDGVQVCLEVGEEGPGMETYLGVLFMREEAVDAIYVPVDAILADVVVVDAREGAQENQGEQSHVQRLLRPEED